MSKLLLLAALVLSSPVLIAQDTTWVQTFTFDTIATRRADFVFPPQLDTMRFEKVLMYYKLKCSPLTPWDQYNCGEWDYLAYTRIFDHTGVMDSVQVDSLLYLSNYANYGTMNYDPIGTYRADSLFNAENGRSGFATTVLSLGMTPSGSSAAPFDLSAKGGRFQMLVTAAELSAAGILPGNIESLALYLDALSGNGELYHPSISLKATSDGSLTAFHETGFTPVYDLSRYSGSLAAELAVGQNEFPFHTPFAWNGTDNLIVEFYFQDGLAAGNSLTFQTESSAPGMALHYPGKNGVIEFDGSNHALLEMSDLDLGNDVTITFWAKGNANTGVNTSILEGYDTLNQRVINIHMPWSNNRMYWDCGEGSGYDRIDKDMTGAGIDNEWHHWAFVKNQGTGEMKIFRDGVLWHSGTGLTRPVGYLHRLILGANIGTGNNWKGKIDEFQVFNTAVADATIASWYLQKTDNTHPDWANLLVYYDFDEEEYALDQTANDYLLMPSEVGMVNPDMYPSAWSEYPVAGVLAADRPLIGFGQGIVSGGAVQQTVPYVSPLEPKIVFEFAAVDRHFEISNAYPVIMEGVEETYDETGNVISSVPFAGAASISNQTITYFQEPFEIVHDVEIGRFITPYGIQFDLGPGGFTWIYDITDYQMYLKDTVDLAAHNTQELIDLKFAFIEGIPPRDVHARQPIWSEWGSYNYANLADDISLPATQVVLSDSSSMFKIKTRFSGHGQVGNQACCEWVSKDHKISIDGVERFNWEIWEETACGDNPNVSQGGTWPYAREGWCPGDLVKEYDHELTPFVSPGASVTFDYDITDVPAWDIGQAGGNYVAAMDLISYSAPNFQNDAAIVDIYNPNSWEYYGKWNPSCQNPRVIIQNTGEQPLTSCRITVWVDWNNKVSYDWTGNLAFLEKEVVEIPIPNYTFWYDYAMSGTFTAHVNYINQSWTLDEYAPNNEKTVNYEAPESINGPFLVWFTTNNKAFENKWRLMDSDGNTIFERLSLANSTVYKDTFDLAPGCYSIVLEDSDNDGISFWYSAQVQGETAGNFVVKLVGGTIVEYFEKDFGNFHQYNFTVGYDLGIEDLGDVEEELNIYPNPNDGNFDVEISGNIGHEAELFIYDILGREVFSEKMNASLDFASSKVSMSALPAGHYIVKVQTRNGNYSKEFIKQ